MTKVSKTSKEVQIAFRRLEGVLLDVTQMAAISAARAAGSGDKEAADQAAVETMREQLSSIEGLKTIVKIGEGERDRAPMLYIGEEIGQGDFTIDIAVDPLENTNATSKLGPNAICVLAASLSGGLISASDGYMDKLVVGPRVKNVNINYPVETNISIIANSLKRNAEDITITVLDRDRNAELIKRIRATGARARVIPDGDLIPGILSCIAGVSSHALMGIGASPEGVITAAAVKILRGHMQAKFWTRGDKDSERYFKMGIDLSKVYTEKNLAPGNNLIVCITAVTALSTATKHILDGVSFFGGGAKTDSLLITQVGKKSLEHVRRTHVLDEEKFVKGGSEFMLDP